MTFEEEFSEAYQNWEINRLYLDLADAGGKPLSPNAKIFLRGVLCANSPNEIAKKLNYQSKNLSDTVRQTLSKEVYPAIENLVNSGNKINWRKTSENSVSQLLKDYRKKTENSPPTPTEIKIDWHWVCAKMLEKQQTNQQLRRKATQIGCEVEVFVKLGLVERKLQQRHSDNNGMEKFREKEVITRTYEYDEFLLDVIQGKKNKFIAIVGEAGSGKTTWLDKIANNLKNTKDLYICIPLGNLQGETLEEYILKKWLSNAMLLIDLDIDSATLEKKLTKLLQKDEMWLLLDGVDEIGETSAAKTLRNIQQQLTGLLSAARVVLTCRTNVWDVNFNNPLSGFETYKTLEFKFEQVDDFIHQWFAKAENEKRGEKLEQKLKESRHETIYDLVRNPLRLSLLCQIFYFDENAELPETKAGLYQQFIRYLYEWKPEKIDIDLNIQPNLKNQLHQALGRVALAGLDSSERFRLSESLIYKEFQDDSLLKLALDLDLLVLVDREVKTGEFVYGFFDSSFQEYFAALAIDDWDFFIPRGHVDKPVPGKKYRIFESQWKEVFLLWLGRDNLDIQEKDSLLKALINFEDGCLNIYGYRAYVLAVLGTDYYREFELADEIILTTIDIGFQYRHLVGEREKFPSPISNLAEQTICQINSQKVADKLVKIINNSEHELVWYYAAMILGKLKQKNSSIISVLTNVVEKSQHPYTRSVAAGSLGKVDPGNQIAINILMDTIENSEEEYIYSQAAIYLLEVDANNSVAIKTLVDLIFNSEPTKTQFKLFDKLITNKLGKKVFTEAAISSIEKSKQERHYNLDWIIPYCLQNNLNMDFSQNILNLIEETADVNTCIIATRKISILDKSNSVVIKKMVEFINRSDSDLTSVQIAQELIEIDENNQFAIDTLFDILTNSDCEVIQAASAWGLRKIKVNDLRVTVIVELVKNLLKKSEEEMSLVLLAGSLAIFEPGNSLALNTLAKLIKKSTDEIAEHTDKVARMQAINCLIEIHKVNKNIIKALIYTIKKTTDQTFFILASNQLSYLSNFYPQATGFLLDFLNKYERKFYGQLIHSIVEIQSSAKQFTLPVLEKIENSDSEKLVEEATLGLAMMYKNENKEELLTYLKNSYSQKNVSDNFWRFDAYYQLLWYCSQHINYPDFYNIWNEPKSTIQHLNLTQLPTTLRQHLANNPDFNQTIIPICIDGANFTNPDNSAPDIYIEMIEKGCPEIIPTPTTMSSLKTYWRLNLKKLDKQIALIFYISKSDRSFSEIFLTTLSTLGGSICLISDQKCDNIESISPHHPNLIDTIIKWLRREILEA